LEAEFDKNQKFRADQEAWRKEEIETWQKKYDDQGAGNEKLVSQISELTKQVKGMETDTEKTKVRNAFISKIVGIGAIIFLSNYCILSIFHFFKLRLANKNIVE
jgi:hypothetical protein